MTLRTTLKRLSDKVENFGFFFFEDFLCRLPGHTWEVERGSTRDSQPPNFFLKKPKFLVSSKFLRETSDLPNKK